MPPKENKGKKPPPKPECIAPPEAQPPDEMSPEFYLNQIAELEVCVERLVVYVEFLTYYRSFSLFLEL